jgi:hypothetical protein
MSKRYYVTTQFAVEAEDPQAAEMLVARRLQDMLGTSDVVCEECSHATKREGGNSNAGIFVEAMLETDEEHLREGPPLLVEQLGYVPTEGGKPIPGDGTDG